MHTWNTRRNLGLLIRATLGLAGAALLVGTASADEAVKVVPKFKQGATFYLKMESKNTRTLSGAMMPGGSMVINASNQFGLKGKVVDGGAAPKLELTWDRIVLNIDHPQMKITYDSAITEEQPDGYLVEDIFPMVIGKPVKVAVGKDGRAEKFSGMEAIWAAAEDELGANPMLADFSSGMGDDAMQYLLIDSRHAMYPDKPVKVGDTWTTKITTDNERTGPIEHTYQCKVKSVEQHGDATHVTISYTAESKRTSAEPPPPGPQGVTFDFQSASMEGDAVWDSASGMFVKQNETSKSEILLRSPQGDIPMSQTGETHVTVTDKADGDKAR